MELHPWTLPNPAGQGPWKPDVPLKIILLWAGGQPRDSQKSPPSLKPPVIVFFLRTIVATYTSMLLHPGIPSQEHDICLETRHGTTQVCAFSAQTLLQTFPTKFWTKYANSLHLINVLWTVYFLSLWAQPKPRHFEAPPAPPARHVLGAARHSLTHVCIFAAIMLNALSRSFSSSKWKDLKSFKYISLTFPTKFSRAILFDYKKKNLHAEQQWHNEDKPQTSEQKRSYSSAWMELLHLHVDAKPFLCSYWSVTQAFPASKNPFCIQTEFL